MACDIPVYTYALENWAPDRYQVVVIHEGALSAEEQGLVDRLVERAKKGTPAVNADVRVVDLSGAIDEGR